MKAEIIAITRDDGKTRVWRKGEIVTLKWEHAGQAGEDEFRVVSAERQSHSSIVEIRLEGATE